MSGNPPRYEPFDIGKYILKHRKPVPCPSLIKWGRWMERNRRHVRNTYIGNTQISTVFLGLDHGFEGKPVIFETMIFPDQEYQTRCCTWRDALKMHWEAVSEVRNKDR